MISGIPEDDRLPRHMREMKPMLFGFTVSNIETDEDFQDDFQDTRRTWHVTGRPQKVEEFSREESEEDSETLPRETPRFEESECRT